MIFFCRFELSRISISRIFFRLQPIRDIEVPLYFLCTNIISVDYTKDINTSFYFDCCSYPAKSSTFGRRESTYNETGHVFFFTPTHMKMEKNIYFRHRHKTFIICSYSLCRSFVNIDFASNSFIACSWYKAHAT